MQSPAAKKLETDLFSMVDLLEIRKKISAEIEKRKIINPSTMKKITHTQNEILSEIYRRLLRFHSGQLNVKLLYLAYPSEAKIIKPLGLIEPYSAEAKRCLNWYSLTEKGKVFFGKATKGVKLSEKESLEIFEGKKVINFNLLAN